MRKIATYDCIKHDNSFSISTFLTETVTSHHTENSIGKNPFRHFDFLRHPPSITLHLYSGQLEMIFEGCLLLSLDEAAAQVTNLF